MLASKTVDLLNETSPVLTGGNKEAGGYGKRDKEKCERAFAMHEGKLREGEIL